MKKLVFVLATLVSVALSAQNKDTQKADNFFNRFEYAKAADAYLKLVNKGKADGYVYKQLADSYYNVLNASDANKWYAKIVTKRQEAETYYRYAQMLKVEGKYEEFNKQMQQFVKMAPYDQRAVAFKQNPKYLVKLEELVSEYKVQLMDINSNNSDFGAVLGSDDMLYFASARKEAAKTYGWNEQPYLDLYRAVYNDNGTFSLPIPVEGINSNYHDGPATISADGNTMYFASESFNNRSFKKNKKKRLKEGQVGLYRAVKVNGKWKKITYLPFNGKNYSVSNPSLSKDGKTLYFSSNMPGSIGGIDIWKVSVNENGSYGKPVNLGQKINTKGNESFPFIADDDKLYFASDTHLGFGGLDVYVIDLNKSNDLPTNLGKPVNSEKDDFAFSYNAIKKIGFLSSNRKGSDNIYKISTACDVNVISSVSDAKTGKVLPGAHVAILDDQHNVLQVKVADSTGVVQHTAACNKTYSITVAQKGYESNNFPVTTTRADGANIQVKATLEPVEEVVVDEKGEPLLNEIFFEFAKSRITQQGAKELDKLVQVMKDNPDMVVMVKSHTDSRGSDTFNMDLSERRAKSTVQYVISKGIAKHRISGKGYGESELKVDCGDNCSQEDHAKNRRSEFIIVSR